MVLQGSGQISLSDVQTELGGTTPIGMDEYYTANPNNFTNGISGLPNTASSRMDMSMFYGKGKHVFGMLSPATLSSSVVVFGTKLYRKEYTGPVVQVRRSSDQVTQDFYASTTGALTTARNGTGTSYAAWLGAATGYVPTWYDQSGRGAHLTQSATSNQPVLTTAGKIVYNGTSQFLEKAYNVDVNTHTFSYIVNCKCYSYGQTPSLHQSPLTSRGDVPGYPTGYMVYKYPDPDNGFYHWNGGGNSGWQTIPSSGSGVTCALNTSYNVAGSYNGTVLTTDGQGRVISSTGSVSTTVNGVTTTPSTISLALNESKPFRVGAGATESATGLFFWNGEVNTVMYFNTPISTVDRDTLLANLS